MAGSGSGVGRAQISLWLRMWSSALWQPALNAQHEDQASDMPSRWTALHQPHYSS